MNTINIRAWDTENRVMLEYLPYMSAHPFYIAPDGTVYKDGKVQPYILMLYTTFDDRNGKKIFCGDILNEIHINGSITRGVVVFRKGCFMVHQLGHTYMDDELRNQVRSWTEVIGNIYDSL